jgi:hypothetical protein
VILCVVIRMVTIRAIGSLKEDIGCPGLIAFDMARSGYACFFHVRGVCLIGCEKTLSDRDGYQAIGEPVGMIHPLFGLIPD